MKAVSIKQPWATLLATGATRYNVRSWRTGYRGPLVILAGHRFSEDAIDLCLHEEVRPLLARAGYDYIIQLPVHAIIGMADLVDCVHIGSADLRRFDPEDPAVRLGPFHPENWAWIFRDARPVKPPVHCRGKLGVFSLPDGILNRGQIIDRS